MNCEALASIKKRVYNLIVIFVAIFISYFVFLSILSFMYFKFVFLKRRIIVFILDIKIF